MLQDNHSLVNELPEYKDQIHTLKMNDAHFKRLFEEYHHLDNEIHNMEQEIILASTMEEEEFKKRRLKLKDTMLQMLRNVKHQELAAEA